MDQANGGSAADPQPESVPAEKKRPYEAPSIEDFGSVEDLTAGGTGMMTEAPSNGYSATAA